MYTIPKSNKKFGRLLFVATVLSTIIYMAWRIVFTIPLDLGYWALFFGLGLVVVEFVGMLEAFEHYYNMSHIETLKKQKPPVDWYPHVDVLIATYNEPPALLEKTIHGCINMEYPDLSKVHIYVCDDNRREEVEALAEKMGVNYIKRQDNKHAKAGNFNNALAVTSSPLIVTLDADMIPLRTFLMTLIPYFYAEEVVRQEREKNSRIPELKIGFIQSPQCFYNPDLFQFNLYSEQDIPDEQDYFYRDVQISRNRSNTVIYGGTNTVISRRALEDVGGFFTGVITEDFATGIMIQRKGYRCFAVDEAVATGLSPDDLKSLISQRRRWARGCIQTLKATNFLFGKGWSLGQRIGYLSSVLYWYAPIKRFFYIASPIAFAVFGITVVKCTIYEVLLFWLPMYVLQSQALKRLSGNIRNTRWTNVYETIMFPFLFAAVIMETLGISMRKFAVTKKDGVKEDLRSYQYIKGLPHLLLAIFTVLGIVNCIYYTFATGSMTYFAIIFWLVINLYNLLMAVFFTFGREVRRASERYVADLSCGISWRGFALVSRTIDISEHGFSTVFPQPQYIPDDVDLEGYLANDRFRASFTCRIVKVTYVRGEYHYAFRIVEPADFANKMALYSIVYDRLPSLPDELVSSISLLDDLVKNIHRRLPQEDYSNRRLPRIQVNRLYETLAGDVVRLVNFNYMYALVDSPEKSETPEEMTILVSESISFICSLMRKDVDGCSLYKVMNFKDFVYLPGFYEVLSQWTDEHGNHMYPSVQTEKKGNEIRDFDERAYI